LEKDSEEFKGKVRIVYHWTKTSQDDSCRIDIAKEFQIINQ